MKNYKKNLKLLTENHVYSKEMEKWDEREDTDQETEKILMRTSQKEFKAK